MKINVLVLIALISSNCFAQVSQYEAPCKEKMTAYYTGVSDSDMDKLVEQCVRITEYEMKKQKKVEANKKIDDLNDATAMILKLTKLAAEKGFTNDDINACSDLTSTKALTASEVEMVIACLNAKR